MAGAFCPTLNIFNLFELPLVSEQTMGSLEDGICSWRALIMSTYCMYVRAYGTYEGTSMILFERKGWRSTTGSVFRCRNGSVTGRKT